MPETTVPYEPPLYWTSIVKEILVPKISPSSVNRCNAGTVIWTATALTVSSTIWTTFGLDCETVEKPVGLVLETFLVIGITVWLDVPVLTSKLTSLKLKVPSAAWSGVLLKNIDFAPSTNPPISPSPIRSRTLAKLLESKLSLASCGVLLPPPPPYPPPPEPIIFILLPAHFQFQPKSRLNLSK